MSINHSVQHQADPHINDLTRLHEEDRRVVSELFADAMRKGTDRQRLGALQAFGALAVELADNLFIQQQADEAIENAKRYSKQEEVTWHCTLDGEKLGWIPGDSNITIKLEPKEKHDRKFLFGSIVSQHRVTDTAFKHLEAQGVADTLLQTLTEQSLPRFLAELQSGSRRLRPSNKTSAKGTAKSDDRNLNTAYPAYKLDVQGTNNRAIILLPEKQDGVQVIVLAALYDHEDQDKVLNAIKG